MCSILNLSILLSCIPLPIWMLLLPPLCLGVGLLTKLRLNGVDLLVLLLHTNRGLNELHLLTHGLHGGILLIHLVIGVLTEVPPQSIKPHCTIATYLSLSKDE